MNGDLLTTHPPGWFRDPLGRSAYRHWSGTAWTSWVSDGTNVTTDPLPVRPRMSATDLSHLHFVEEVFLPEARALDLISREQQPGLRQLVDSLRIEAATVGPEQRPSPTQTGTSIWARHEPGVLEAAVPLAAPGPVKPAEPPALVRWWRRTRETVGSDLAVHGLAYLGVLMFFIGAFGLVAFAFGDVAPRLRPVAEAVIALVPFLAAGLLVRRGAVVVGRALEIAGGLVLPIMAITSMVDGVDVPPDLTGPPLVLAVTVLGAAITVGYALWARRRPASGLRFLVGPMAWLTVAMASLGLGRAVPAGKEVAVPGSLQVLVVAVALVATLLLVRWRPAAALSAPTRTSAVPGVGVVGLLAVLTWVAQSPPPTVVVTTGVLLVAAAELLRDRLPVAVLGLVEPLWWGAVFVTLLAQIDPGPAGLVSAAGFLGLVELAAAARRPSWALALAGAGALAALAATAYQPWWAVAACGGVAAWAVARRSFPGPLATWAWTLDLVAAAAPAAALVALAAAADLPTATLAGAVLALLATAPATRPLLRRGEDDAYWAVWWSGAVVLVACAALASWLLAGSARDQWLVVAAIVLVTMATAVGPIPAMWRPWAVCALSLWTWLMVVQALTLPDAVRGGVVAAAALGLVVAGHGRPLTRRRGLAASVALAGHALGAAALVMGGFGWGLALVAALDTAGWMVTTAGDVRDRSPLGSAAGALDDRLRFVPPALAGVGVPATAITALHAATPVTWSTWASVVLATTAVLYALASRWLPQRLAATLAPTATAVAVLGALTATSRLSAVLALGAVVASAIALPAARRTQTAVWLAWAAVVPLAGLLLVGVPAFADLPWATQTAWLLVTGGSVLALVAFTADLQRHPWRPRWRPERPAGVPAAVVGGLEVVAGVTLTLGWVPTSSAGPVTAAAAVGVLAVALASGIGLLSGASVLLAWAAVLEMDRPAITGRPLVAVAVAAALLTAAWATSRIRAPQWWARWDVPLLVAAALVAATGLVVAVGSDRFVATYLLTGVEVLGVAVVLRHRPPMAAALSVVGVSLVLAAAFTAGPWWLALALAGVAVGLTALATRSGGGQRLLLQVGGAIAAVGAWGSAVVALEWPVQRAVDVTSLLAGGLALAAVAAAGVRRLDRSWSLVWGTAWLCVLAATAVLPSRWVVTGLVLGTLAVLLGADRLQLPWLRGLGAAALLGTELLALLVWDASPAAAVTALSGTTVAAALLALATTRLRPWVWRWPVLGLGTAAAGVAVAVAAQQLPDRSALVGALAVAAVQAAAIGVAVPAVAAQVFAPVLACAAWLVYASSAVGADPQWFTIPVGLTLLVVVGLWRHDLRLRDRPLAPWSVVTLELVGVGLLVAASFVQAVTDSVGYALLAALLGLGVSAWGTLTRVRRRLAAGATVVVAALVVLVAVPLVRLLPQWTGATLWLVIAAAGVAALAAATLLEQGRVVVRRAAERFGEVTAGWE